MLSLLQVPLSDLQLYLEPRCTSLQKNTLIALRKTHSNASQIILTQNLTDSILHFPDYISHTASTPSHLLPLVTIWFIGAVPQRGRWALSQARWFPYPQIWWGAVAGEELTGAALGWVGCQNLPHVKPRGLPQPSGFAPGKGCILLINNPAVTLLCAGMMEIRGQGGHLIRGSASYVAAAAKPNGSLFYLLLNICLYQ